MLCYLLMSDAEHMSSQTPESVDSGMMIFRSNLGPRYANIICAGVLVNFNMITRINNKNIL